MISHYRVVRRLGAGGMGEVLLAEDTQLERSVAIKLMSAELAKDENQRKRFRTEARAASGLSHPNICVVHEVGETEDGRPFLAMEFVTGQTLADIMQQRRLKIREIISLGAQVADALDAAHARRLVHRDIKPANIMVDARGHVKVLDFGLAKGFAQDELSATTNSVALTQTGMLIGTPHYMSPEQALGRDLDQRSDIFSLGIVLYELIAGQRPFLGKTVGETINNIVNQTPDSLGLENPIFSPTLDGIICKCLEKDPARRYASGRALAEDLNRLKVESERAMVGRETPVVTPAPAAGTTAEPTRLWELAGQANRKSNPALIVAIVAVLGLVMLGGWALFRSKSSSGAEAAGGKSGPATAQKSVAVLPFDNFSAEKDTEFLSDGLTEEITTALSRIPGLKVAARNSAFTFKGKKEDLRKVGAALGVTTLLEGSLRKAGRQMRVTAQLINVADGYHLWSETYDRGVDDIIAVQEEIALKIAEKFELKVGDTAAPATRRAAPNMEAYALYLQGLHLWNKRTKTDLEKAAQLFNQAIDKDATYAAAHAGLASCYVLLPDYAQRPTSEYFPLARAAAGRALELDPTSADAHAVLGLAKSYSSDNAGAEEEFKRALKLNPNHATARHWYGVLLREAGRMDEAYTELRRAEELDPLSPIIKVNVLTWMGYARQYDRGLEETRRDLEAFPNFALFHGMVGWFLGQKGQFKEAIDELLTARASVGDSPYSLDSLGYAYARAGDETRARQLLAELEEWKKKGYATRNGIALVHLGLREFDRALDAYEEAFAAGENWTGLLGDPTFDELRPNPRFQALLRKVGLKK
jgi:serine/threonine-protein kinase